MKNRRSKFEIVSISIHDKSLFIFHFPNIIFHWSLIKAERGFFSMANEKYQMENGK